MLEIIGFYFSLVGKLFDKILNTFEIFPGVSYAIFIIASIFIIMIINLIKLNFDEVSFTNNEKRKGVDK